MHPVRLGSLLILLTAGCVPPQGGYATQAPAPAPAPPPAQLAVAGSGQALTQVTQDPAPEGTPALSPDGQVLLLTSQVDEVVNGQYTGNKSESVIVGVAPNAGSARTVYTSNRFFSQGSAWVPRGGSFVFATNQMGQGNRMSLVKALSSSPNPAIAVVVSGETAENLDSPNVSPDGRRVTFQMTMRGAPMIGIADLNGSNFTVLTEGMSPSFSPDGTRILFARHVGDVLQLFLVDAATGSNLVQLTNDPVQHGFPAWSPDGQFIVFTSNAGWDQYGAEGAVGTTWNLFVIRPDGTGLTQLTTGPRWIRQPHWGADGWIYFSCNEAGSWDIWKINPGLQAAPSPEPPPAEPAPAPAPEPT